MFKLTIAASKKVGKFNQDLISVGQTLENRIQEQEVELKELLRRFDYVERKVGGELQDLLVRQYLEQQGFLVRDEDGNLVPNPRIPPKK